MNYITIGLQKKEQDNKRKGQEKKHGLDERIQLREGEVESKVKKGKFVLKEVWDK